jgi:plastocyanin
MMKRLLTFISALSLILAGCATPPPIVTVTLPPADITAPQATVEPTQPPLTATHTYTAEPATQASIPTSTNTATTTPTEAPTEPPTSTPTQAPTATPGTVFVTYQDFEIVPSQITIPVGTTVVFLIKGGFLSFHQPYNFDPPNVFESPSGLGDGATWSYIFNEPGTVTIRCGYHSEMVATVVVTP